MQQLSRYQDERGAGVCASGVTVVGSKCVRGAARVCSRRTRVARTSSGVGGRRTGCVDAMRRCAYSGICAEGRTSGASFHTRKYICPRQTQASHNIAIVTSYNALHCASHSDFFPVVP